MTLAFARLHRVWCPPSDHSYIVQAFLFSYTVAVWFQAHQPKGFYPWQVQQRSGDVRRHHCSTHGVAPVCSSSLRRVLGVCRCCFRRISRMRERPFCMVSDHRDLASFSAFVLLFLLVLRESSFWPMSLSRTISSWGLSTERACTGCLCARRASLREFHTGLSRIP